MPCESACPRWIVIAALCAPPTRCAVGSPTPRGAPARHDRPPRKVIIGTTMTRWYGDYPGLSGRLEEMRGLIDQMAGESCARYGRSLDPALFTEYAVTAGKPGPAVEVAVPLDGAILEVRLQGREHHTYSVFGGVFRVDPATGSCSNAAVLIDRSGPLAGRYDKVHPVLDRVRPDGKIVLEGGVRPGADYKVLDLDFGRVGVQSVTTSSIPRVGDASRSEAPNLCSSPAIPAVHPPRHVRGHPRILGRLVHVPEQCLIL